MLPPSPSVFGSVPSTLLTSVPVYDPWEPDMPTRTLPTLSQQRQWTRQHGRTAVLPKDGSSELGWEGWSQLRLWDPPADTSAQADAPIRQVVIGGSAKLTR